jgi:hypothetical protein
MYGPIEEFSVKTFIDDNYPTDDDSVCQQNVIDYMTLSLIKKKIQGDDMDHFIKTFITRLRVISELYKKDDCEMSIIYEIAKNIDDDLKYLIREKNDIMTIAKGKYFVDLSTLPDAVKFYRQLIDENNIHFKISRKKLEIMYNECNLQSNFSNVLFTLSWLNVLRVYNVNSIYFNYRSLLHF